jgi:hypothetical protein
MTQTYRIEATSNSDSHWQLQAALHGQKKAMSALSIFEKQQCRKAIAATEEKLNGENIPIQASAADFGSTEFAIAAAQSELAALREFGSNSRANLECLERISALKAFG